MKHLKWLRIPYDSCSSVGRSVVPSIGHHWKSLHHLFILLLFLVHHRTWLMHCLYLKYQYNSMYETSHLPYDTTYSAQVFPLLSCIELELRRQTQCWLSVHGFYTFPLGFWEKLLSQGTAITSHTLELLIPLMHAPSLAVCVVLICSFPLNTLASSHPRSYQYVWITFQTKTLCADHTF